MYVHICIMLLSSSNNISLDVDMYIIYITNYIHIEFGVREPFSRNVLQRWWEYIVHRTIRDKYNWQWWGYNIYIYIYLVKIYCGNIWNYIAMTSPVFNNGGFIDLSRQLWQLSATGCNSVVGCRRLPLFLDLLNLGHIPCETCWVVKPRGTYGLMAPSQHIQKRPKTSMSGNISWSIQQHLEQMFEEPTNRLSNYMGVFHKWGYPNIDGL